jgi:hypothetical protein
MLMYVEAEGDIGVAIVAAAHNLERESNRPSKQKDWVGTMPFTESKERGKQQKSKGAYGLRREWGIRAHSFEARRLNENKRNDKTSKISVRNQLHKA